MEKTRQMEAIERQIAEAKERVVAAKRQYDKSCEELEELMAERDGARELSPKDELWEAFKASGLSYEELLAYVSGPNVDDWSL